MNISINLVTTWCLKISMVTGLFISSAMQAANAFNFGGFDWFDNNSDYGRNSYRPNINPYRNNNRAYGYRPSTPRWRQYDEWEPNYWRYRYFDRDDWGRNGRYRDNDDWFDDMPFFGDDNYFGDGRFRFDFDMDFDARDDWRGSKRYDRRYDPRYGYRPRTNNDYRYRSQPGYQAERRNQRWRDEPAEPSYRQGQSDQDRYSARPSGNDRSGANSKPRYNPRYGGGIGGFDDRYDDDYWREYSRRNAGSSSRNEPSSGSRAFDRAPYPR